MALLKIKDGTTPNTFDCNGVEVPEADLGLTQVGQMVLQVEMLDAVCSNCTDIEVVAARTDHRMRGLAHAAFATTVPLNSFKVTYL